MRQSSSVRATSSKQRSRSHHLRERPERHSNGDASVKLVPVLDIRLAKQHLNLLAPGETRFTFQTFDDKLKTKQEEENERAKKEGSEPVKIKDKLAKILHGTLEQHWRDLVSLNNRGAGVFVTVNRTDLKGRRTHNIVEVRALFQEDDQGFEGTLPLVPTFEIKTSPGKGHRYWSVRDAWAFDDEGKRDHADCMRGLVENFGSDKDAKDISRVLRLAGFLHNKGEPHLVTLGDASGQRYTRAELVEAFAMKAQPRIDAESGPQGATRGKKRLRSALAAIPIEKTDAVGNYVIGRNEWFKVLAGIHDWHAGEAGRMLAEEWSRRDAERFSEAEFEKAWNSLSRGYEGQKITIATVFSIASDYGWEDPHEGRTSQIDILLEAALRECNLFRNSASDCFADVRIDNHRETYRLDSSRFKAFLGKLFFDRTQRGCNDETIRTVLQTLNFKALYSGEVHEAYLRIAGFDDVVWIDLGTPDWAAVKVTPECWQVVKEPEVRFFRTKNMQPLPVPVDGGNEGLWFEELGLEYEQFLLSTIWATHVLRGKPPFLLAYITGPSGSAKTTLAKRLMALTSPPNNKGGHLNTPPKELTDLFIAAKNNFVLGFDNVSHISNDVSDAYCVLLTGGARSKRRLHTDDEEHTIDFVRPMTITAIPDIPGRQDLVDRSLIIRLRHIPEEKRKSSDELEKHFTENAPKHFGFLLDLVAEGMRELPNIKLARLPRMADFACWGVAVEKPLGGDPLFADVYIHNRQGALEELADNNPVVQAIESFMDKQVKYTARGAELLKNLTPHAPDRFSKSWPKTASTLSSAINRNVQVLEAIGIKVSKGEGRKRREITLSKEGKKAAEAPEQASQE